MEKVAALFGKKGVKAVQKFHKAMMTAFRIADYAGLSLKPAPLGDFSDPDVQIWNNVIFADNYYQSVAPWAYEEGEKYFTLTPNGRPLSGSVVTLPGGSKPGNAPEIEVLLGIANQAVTGEDGKVTNSAVEGYSLITVNGQEIRGENSMAGFEEDDIVPVLSFLSDIIGIGEVGLGGAHDRVWQWYAGTIDTGETELLGNPIFRRVVDEGKATYALGILPTQQFNAQPWYPINITTDGSGSEERSEEHTSELQSLMRSSYAVFC